MEQMWQPMLIEIVQRGKEDPYFAKFGFDQLVVPDHCVHVLAGMERLTERFNERYGFRMLNQGVLEKWQIRLQNKMDEVVDKYERAYALYEEHAEGIMDDIKTGVRRTLDGQNQASGTDTNTRTNTVKRIDTPDSAVNANDGYADSYEKGDGTSGTTYGRKDVNSVTEVTEATGILLENINKTINAYRDIDTEFIKEFENNFLNVFWY